MAEGTYRIATVSDGLDAVMLLAPLVAGLREVEARTDLQFAEARETLNAMAPGSVDLLLVAPRPGNLASDMLKTIIAAGEDIGATVLLILAEGSPVPQGLPPHIRCLTGPPFTRGTLPDLEAAATGIAPRQGEVMPLRARGLRRLTGRLRRRPKDADVLAEAESDKGAMEAPVAPLDAIALQGATGGVGATTVAVGLAVGLARHFANEGGARSVCLVDLDLQFGSVSSYLGLPPNKRISDVYRNVSRIDTEAFRACVQTAEPGLQVFAAPPDLIPMDALDPESFDTLLGFALAEATCVIIDMPTVVTDWSEQVYRSVDRTYFVHSLEIRASLSAQKRARMMNALSLPAKAQVHLLNRVPSQKDRRAPEWRLRLESYESGIDAGFARLLPEGGDVVRTANDLGRVLQEFAPRNALTRALDDLASGLAGDIRHPVTHTDLKLAGE